MSKTIKFRDIFSDPDEVGQSEYRAIHDCIEDALEETNLCDSVDPDAIITIEEAEHAFVMLEEFKHLAEGLQQAIVQQRGLIKGDEFIIKDSVYNHIYVVGRVDGDNFYVSQLNDPETARVIKRHELHTVRITQFSDSPEEETDG